MIAHVLDRVRHQTSGPIAINANLTEEYARLEHEVICDKVWEKAGPLAGIRTAMVWASGKGAANVLTLAVDVPFFPRDLLQKLRAVGTPAIATAGDRWHPVNGLWQADQIASLDAYLEQGKRSVHGWAERCGANLANFGQVNPSADAFWNVNTPTDMAKAEQMLAALKSQ